MEYTYKFNDGTQNTVPVNETIGKALEELDRKQKIWSGKSGIIGSFP